MSARETTTTEGAAQAAFPVRAEQAFHEEIWDAANHYRTVEIGMDAARNLAYLVLDRAEKLGLGTDAVVYEAERWLATYGRDLFREKRAVEAGLRGQDALGWGLADGDYQEEIPAGRLVAVVWTEAGDDEGCDASWTIQDARGRTAVVPAGSLACLAGSEPEEGSR